MASFTACVELHDEDADYNALHAAMKKGFSKKITRSKGTYHLPDPEYDYESEKESAEDVRQKASDAAKTVAKDYGVLVTEVRRRVWQGLNDA